MECSRPLVSAAPGDAKEGMGRCAEAGGQARGRAEPMARTTTGEAPAATMVRIGPRPTLDGLFPATEWRAGDHIRERFTITLPAGKGKRRVESLRRDFEADIFEALKQRIAAAIHPEGLALIRAGRP
jgi:hypothetical protein